MDSGSYKMRKMYNTDGDAHYGYGRIIEGDGGDG